MSESSSWLLVSGIPSGSVIGFDANIWKVNSNFRGIKNIPVGMHYFFYSPAGMGSEMGLRCSQFLNFAKSGIVCKKWVPEDEAFKDLELEGDLQISRSEDLAGHLLPYPEDKCSEWIALSSFLRPSIVKRLEPVSHIIYSCPQLISIPSTSQDRAQLPFPAHLTIEASAAISNLSISTMSKQLPDLKSIPETAIRFTLLPDHPRFPLGATAAEVSHFNIDQTYTLDSILSELLLPPPDPNEQLLTRNLLPSEAFILGELQFTFIVFILGEVLEGWFHWRRLVTLLCNCELAIAQRPRFYTALISCLYRQLMYTGSSGDGEAPGMSLFESDVQADFNEWSQSGPEPAFLPRTLSHLFANIAALAGDRNPELIEVYDRADGLRKCLERKFKVNLSVGQTVENGDGCLPISEVDWDNDEAPVIVM